MNGSELIILYNDVPVHATAPVPISIFTRGAGDRLIGIGIMFFFFKYIPIERCDNMLLVLYSPLQVRDPPDDVAQPYTLIPAQ